MKPKVIIVGVLMMIASSPPHRLRGWCSGCG